MARRSKDENQLSLFDLTPIKSAASNKRVASTVLFIPTKKEIVVYVIGYKEGLERYHQSVELGRVDSHKQFQLGYGDYTFKVYGFDDYWEKYKAGGFELGK